MAHPRPRASTRLFVIRQLIKRLLRPLVAWLLVRIDHRTARAMLTVEQRLDSAEATLQHLDVDVATFKGYVPAVLNAIASQNAAARGARRAELQLDQRVEELSRRLEEVSRSLQRLEAARGVGAISGPATARRGGEEASS